MLGVTILTVSQHGPDYLLQCAGSVLSQTHGEWEWWVAVQSGDQVALEVTTKLAALDPRIKVARDWMTGGGTGRDLTAQAVNRLLPKTWTEFLMVLPDSDLLTPNALRCLVDRGHSINYGQVSSLRDLPSGVTTSHATRSDVEFHHSTEWPGTKLTWGQVLFSREVFTGLSDDPAPENPNHWTLVSATLFNKLATSGRFHPVSDVCLINRPAVTTGVKFRSVTEDDLGWLMDERNSSRSGFFDQSVITAEQQQLWWKNLDWDSHFVVTVGSSPAAYFHLDFETNYFQGVMIRKRFRGRGLLREMTRLLPTVIRNHNAPAHVRVIAANTSVVTAYERCGFVERKRYDDHGHLTVYMELER